MIYNEKFRENKGVHVPAHMHTHNVHAHMYMHVYIYAYTHMHMYMCVHMHMYIYMYMHTCITNIINRGSKGFKLHVATRMIPKMKHILE